MVTIRGGVSSFCLVGRTKISFFSSSKFSCVPHSVRSRFYASDPGRCELSRWLARYVCVCVFLIRREEKPLVARYNTWPTDYSILLSSYCQKAFLTWIIGFKHAKVIFGLLHIRCSLNYFRYLVMSVLRSDNVKRSYLLSFLCLTRVYRCQSCIGQGNLKGDLYWQHYSITISIIFLLIPDPLTISQREKKNLSFF